MNSETRVCQNSGKSKYCMGEFTITPDDFTFYEKIKVPAPTFCPECRLQRRLVWMKGIDLFYRKCDLCQEMKLSMYHPDAPYVVYCDRCWWSDGWDARDCAIEYDATKTFLEQWNELLHKTPLLGLSVDKNTSELSSFCNHVGHSKECSLIFYSDQNENCLYGYEYARTKNVLNSGIVMESENVYDSCHVYKSYNLVHAFGNNRFCYDSYFLRDCEGVSNSFGVINGRKDSYTFLGEKLSKDAYQEKLLSIDLGSRTQYDLWKSKVQEYFKTIPARPAWDSLSVDCTGSYVFHSKNAHNCYDVIECEDSKYLMLVKTGKVTNTYDYGDWGENVDSCYESLCVGGGASHVLFSHESGFNLQDIEYSKLTGWGSSNMFGCVSMRKQSYCILNKQYTKEEYDKLKAQIISEMSSNPYIAKDGNVYRYGEFFPLDFSPHSYNDTFGSRFFPLTKQEVSDIGLKWQEVETREYKITKQIGDLPDNIKEVDQTILSEVIQCPNCPRGYKILASELQFLQKHNLPLPVICPFCRIWEKVDGWVDNMKLVDRICDKCHVSFSTHLKVEPNPIVYCKDCWKQTYL